MGSGVRFNGFVNRSFRRNVRIGPQVYANAFVQHVLHKSLGLGKTSGIPFESTRIRFALPARLEANKIKRVTAVFEIFRFLLYHVGSVQALHTLGKTKSPTRRQWSAAIV